MTLAGPGLRADDFREEGLGRSIAMKDVVLATLLVIEYELYRHIGTARPPGIRDGTAVAPEIAGIGFAHEPALSCKFRPAT